MANNMLSVLKQMAQTILPDSDHLWSSLIPNSQAIETTTLGTNIGTASAIFGNLIYIRTTLTHWVRPNIENETNISKNRPFQVRISQTGFLRFRFSLRSKKIVLHPAPGFFLATKPMSFFKHRQSFLAKSSWSRTQKVASTKGPLKS